MTIISLFTILLFSIAVFVNYSVRNSDIDNKNIDIQFIKNANAAEEDKNNKDEDKDDKNSFTNNANSIFNIAAVGDWDCTGETEDTVDNIVDKQPEVVLALGDFSYSGDADCWFKKIEPIADKTKIAMGNHHDGDDYLDYFGLKDEYYSFNYKNVHILALSTEIDYDDESKQYKFAVKDLEKYSKDPLIKWILVFYHRYIYGSGSLPPESDFRELYHPLFDKYKVDLALQGHLHVYERTYPIIYNEDDDDEPIVQDNNPSNIFKNPKGPIVITVGTGGAHDMILSSLEDYAAKGIDGKFGVLDLEFEDDQKTLKGSFIENGKKKKVLDEFEIVKER